MTCSICQAEVTESSQGDDFFPRCPRCGKLLVTPMSEAELRGFRARLAQFGLGDGREPEQVSGMVEEG